MRHIRVQTVLPIPWVAAQIGCDPEVQTTFLTPTLIRTLVPGISGGRTPLPMHKELSLLTDLSSSGRDIFEIEGLKGLSLSSKELPDRQRVR